MPFGLLLGQVVLLAPIDLTVLVVLAEHIHVRPGCEDTMGRATSRRVACTAGALSFAIATLAFAVGLSFASFAPSRGAIARGVLPRLPERIPFCI